MYQLYKILLIIIIILIILLYIIYTLFYREQTCESYDINLYINYKDIKDTLKQGDIILFSAYSFEISTRLLGDQSYSHIGMVIEDENKLYSLEMVDGDYILPGEQLSYNIIKTPLYERIANYGGYVFISSKREINTYEENDKIKKISNRQYKFSTKSEQIKTILFNKNYKNNKFCSEYIAEILTELNIIDSNNTSKRNIHSEIIKLCGGKIYMDPIRIITDLQYTTNLSNNKSITNIC
jgi:hypothetical protein